MATANKKPKTEPKAEPETQAQDDDMMTSTPQSNGDKSPMLQLGGLWINESNSGNKYMSGYLGNLKIMIFRNKFKTEDKHPDYVMRLAEKQRDTESEAEKDKDDIPF